MKKLIATEEQEHLALMQWARLHPICKEYLIHIPNGGYRHKGEAKKLKAMGVKAGVSDFFLAYPCSLYSYGLWIELKRNNLLCKPTVLQQKWLIKMKDAGYVSAVAYGWEHAKQIIEDYLGEG
jgi:hypothetical protein